MIEESKIVKVISHINKLTKLNQVLWTIRKGTFRITFDSNEELIGFVYDTKFKGKLLRLFKFSYRDYVDYDEYTLSSSVKLSFIDEIGNSLWDFPFDRGLNDLYETVRFKTSNIEEFFNDLDLEDENNESLSF